MSERRLLYILISDYFTDQKSIRRSVFPHNHACSLFIEAAGAFDTTEVWCGCYPSEPHPLCNATLCNLECLMGPYCFKSNGFLKRFMQKKKKNPIYRIGVWKWRIKTGKNSIKIVGGETKSQNDNGPQMVFTPYCSFYLYTGNGRQIWYRTNRDQLIGAGLYKWKAKVY